jgi:hypothetical protein
MTKVYVVVFDTNADDPNNQYAYVDRVYANKQDAEKYVNEQNALQQSDDDPDVRNAGCYISEQELIQSL